jgi:hypothetical protein
VYAVETDEATPARTPGERGKPIAHHRRHAKALRRGGAQRTAFAGANLADRERGGGGRRGTIVAINFAQVRGCGVNPRAAQRVLSKSAPCAT